MKPAVAFRTASKCSCTQCNSIDCFKIRNHNSTLLCTCNNCMETCKSSNKDLSENKLNKNNRDLIGKKIKDTKQRDSFVNVTKTEKSEVNNEHTKYSYKDVTLITDKGKQIEKSYEKSYTRNYSVAVTYSRKEEKPKYENPTAILSAQVMNLPFQEFNDSLLPKKNVSPLSPKKSQSSKKLSKPDILMKIKEIYKACSCKVCECIIGKSCFTSINAPICDCENIDSSNNGLKFNQIPHSGCPCVRCDRKDCRGVVKPTRGIDNCDCEPCDCVNFPDSFTEPCECEPCQCAECTPVNFNVPQSITVAPVQGNFQQNHCDCEPCECVSCTHNYGAMASNLMRETSTGMSTQRNCNCDTCLNDACQMDGVNCRCDRQNRIMRKPIDRISRDYDVRQAMIEDNNFSLNWSSKNKKYDTIAMFALSGNYSNVGFNKSKDFCQCTECECIECKDKDIYGSKIRNTYYDNFPRKLPKGFNNSLSACQCQPCECQVCCNDKKTSNLKYTRVLNKCQCDICDCIICNGLPYCSQNNKINNCSKSAQMSDATVTHSIYQAKMLSKTLSKSQSQMNLPELARPLPCTSILKIQGNNLNKTVSCSQNISVCQTKPINKYFSSVYNQTDSQNQQSLKSIIILSDPSNIYSNNNLINNETKKLENEIGFLNKFTKVERVDNNPNNKVPQNSSPTCNEKNKNKIISDENYLGKNKGHKLFNSNQRLSKVINSDDFCARIVSFEEAISQLQQDISQRLKTLAQIRSEDIKLHGNLNERDDEINFSDNLETKMISKVSDPTKVEFCEETEERGENVFNTDRSQTNSIENGYNDKNNGYNKMYSRLIKRTRKNVPKSTRVKKLSRNSENIINNNLINQLKESYGHRNLNKNKLNLKSDKFTTISCEKVSVTDYNYLNLKSLQDSNDRPQLDIDWSVLRKNLFPYQASDRCSTGVCTLPELELNIKKAVKSVSLQTNELRENMALTKLQTKVVNVLNSSLIQSSRCDQVAEDNQNMTARPKSKLDLELKSLNSDAAAQTRKLFTQVEKEVNCNIEQSREEITQEMKHLMEFTITRSVCKSELTRPSVVKQKTLRTFTFNTVKSSCDDLKVCFVGVRKVSYHTVLLRWKMPRDMASVQGYELQVDGRAVQKILSPTRCMAVLTCLPHYEKLLLTIRTLTTSVSPSGHHPVSTLVYCPREKTSSYSPSMYLSEELRRR